MPQCDYGRCLARTNKRCAYCGYFLCPYHSKGHDMYKAGEGILEDKVYNLSKTAAEGAKKMDEGFPRL